MRRIDLKEAQYFELSVISEKQAYELGALKDKGWSFANIYHLKELRNIYLALKTINFNGDITKFTKFCTDNVPYEDKIWSYRKVIEYINAFKNFGLLDEKNSLQANFFKDKHFDEPLSVDDIDALKSIFYSYFRFKEIHSWFLKPESVNRKDSINEFTTADLISKSMHLYTFSYNSRFTDAFITQLTSTPTVFYLSNSIKMNLALMRFWDVYVKWGRTLGVIEKFSLENLDIRLLNNGVLNCIFHINNLSIKLNLYDYIFENFGKNKVFIPDLVLKIALEGHYRIEDVKKFIIDNYIQKRDHFSIDNTSEIFIKVENFKKKEVIFYPLYRDSYISHITIIK